MVIIYYLCPENPTRGIAMKYKNTKKRLFGLWLFGFVLMFWVACDKGNPFPTQEQRDEAEKLIKGITSPDSLKAIDKFLAAKNNQIGRVIVMREWGKYLRNESRFDEALQVHSEGLHIAEALHDTIEWIQALNNIGTNYRRLGILDAAQEYHYLAWKMSEATRDTTKSAKKNRVISLNGLGNIYMTLGNFERADSVLRVALKGEKELKSFTGQAINYANIGSIFLRREQVDSAWVYYRKSMDLNQQANNKLGISLCYTYFGSLYERECNYDAAYEQYEKALELMKASKDDWHVLPTLIALAHIDYSTGKTARALERLKSSEEIARKIKSKEHLAEIYNLYYLIYQKQGAYQQALTNHVQATILKDSVVGAEKVNRIQNISLNIERRRQTEQMLKSEQALSTERARQYLIIGVALGLIALTMGFALMLFYTQRVRTRSYQSLKKMSLLRENFFTNITDEFRTPLTVILGLSDEISKDKNVDKETHNKVTTIHQQGKNLLTFVNQLLDISKIKSTVGDPDWRHGNLSAYITMIVESYRDYAHSKKIDLHLVSKEEIHTDFVPNYINKIINNLLSNAFKFTPEYGKVTITLSKRDEKLLIEVEDSGVGISEEHLHHLFELFYQVEGENSAAGSGIGLSLVKQIVDALNGTIIVRSTEGKGSCFTVTLPIHYSGQVKSIDLEEGENVPMLPTKEIKLKDSPVDDDDNKRILVIEDNRDVAAYIGKTLSDHYAIFYASNGKEGLEKANEIVPDLIITDLMMPVMDGLQVCSKVRTNEVISHVPIIVITAKTTEKDRIEGLKAGADAYLSKPFSSDELRTRVDKLLEQRELLRGKYLLDAFSAMPEISIKKEDETENTLERANNQLFLNKMVDIVYLMITKEQEIDVNIMASKLCMSPRQFYRKVAALTGYTPLAYIQRIKVHKAKQMMIDDADLPLKEVAEQSGFSDYSNFSRSFKNVEGVTPTQWQAAKNNELNN